MDDDEDMEELDDVDDDDIDDDDDDDDNPSSWRSRATPTSSRGDRTVTRGSSETFDRPVPRASPSSVVGTLDVPPWLLEAPEEVSAFVKE